MNSLICYTVECIKSCRYLLSSGIEIVKSDFFEEQNDEKKNIQDS